MYHCAETFLSSTPPPPLFAPIVTQWFYRGACCWKTRLRKISIKGGVFLCGSQESLASGFHPKYKGVFLPDLYSFTQWVGLPLLFPSKESPDETFVRPIIGYVHVASSSASLGVQQPLCPKWIPSIPLFKAFFSYKCSHKCDFFSLGSNVMSVMSSCATRKPSCQNPKPTNYKFEKVSVGRSPSWLSPSWPTLDCQGIDKHYLCLDAHTLKLVLINLFKSAVSIKRAFWLLFSGVFPDCVSRVDPQGGEARFREQQDLLYEPLSSIHQPVLQRASDEGHALRWHPVWQRDGEWNKT